MFEPLRFLMKTSPVLHAVLGSLFLLLAACESYVPPGGPARLEAISNPQVREGFAAKPAANFPAVITPVRLQDANYSSRSVQSGASLVGQDFSVVTVRELETEADLARLAKMPQVAGIAPISRMLLPSRGMNSTQLREAAARLNADILLLYTFDTSFRSDDQSGLLTTLSLGVAPTKSVSVTTTASALFVDTRTGYLFGAAESTVSQKLRSNAWLEGGAMDKARLELEKEGFQKLLGETERTWTGIVLKNGQR